MKNGHIISRNKYIKKKKIDSFNLLHFHFLLITQMFIYYFVLYQFKSLNLLLIV